MKRIWIPVLCVVLFSTTVYAARIGGGGDGGSSSVTLEQAKSNGRVITSATTANPVEIGDGTRGIEAGGDATLGAFVRPKPLTDTSWLIFPTFKGCIKDVNAGATMLCFAPSAGTRNGMYLVEPNYRPLTTIHVPLNPRGTASGGYESIVTNQPNDYYITLTDADTSAVDFTFFVTNRMAGATTVTFRLVGVSKNASPANNIAFDCAMSSFTPGTDTYTAHVTTGEVRALLTPATQNRPVAVTTSSHTINGGPLVAGDIVKGSCEVHATDTTSTQLTDFRLEAAVAVTLEVNSFSE